MTRALKTQKTALPKDLGFVDQIHDYGLDIYKRELYLFPREEYLSGGHEEGAGEPGVEFGMANRFIKNLRILSTLSNDPILIHLKSCGGYWEEGMAMYQAMTACPCEIIILNYASARSMSSLIFLAANRRYMMPYSTFMFHMGTATLEGTGTQVRTQYEELKKADNQMIDIYVKALRGCDKMAEWNDSKIRKWVETKMKQREDVYLSAEEAVEYNFADGIFGKGGVYDWDALKKGSQI